MNDPNYVVIIQGLKQCIMFLYIVIKLLGGNIKPSVLITIGYIKGFDNCLSDPASYRLQKHGHLNFPYGKVKAIKLGWSLDSVGHGY